MEVNVMIRAKEIVGNEILCRRQFALAFLAGSFQGIRIFAWDFNGMYGPATTYSSGQGKLYIEQQN